MTPLRSPQFLGKTGSIRQVVRGILFVLAVSPLTFSSHAQEGQQPKQEEKKESLTEGLPQRELSKEERERREEAFREELQDHFRKWLEEDVFYIITPEEKTAFKDLQTDEERQEFIEQFWLRRDPTPDTIENEFKEEHYRRITYANERLGGWRSDRGMTYIIHGPPEEIESMPTGGFYNRLPEEGGGGTSAFPFERWRYRYIEGVGSDIVLEFVDRCMCGDYQLTMDPSEKDALTMSLGHGLTWLEQLGLARKQDRFVGHGDGTRMPEAWSKTVRLNEFERLQLHARVQKPEPVKFKDLEALVDTRISFNLLPFELRTDFLRVTSGTVLVPITIGIKKKDVTFKLQNGIHRSTVNVFGRVRTLTGRIVETFEDVIQLDIPPSLFGPETLEEMTVYQKAIPLRPGLYKLNLVVKDINSGNVGALEKRLPVPRFEEDQLAHSSLILADQLERIPSKNIGRGQFVIGDTKVRPALSQKFSPNDRMGIYMQTYNLGLQEKTRQPKATIEYIIRNGEEVLFSHEETTVDLEHASQQLTLKKVVRLIDLRPGDYTLTIKVTDHIRQQSLSTSTHFYIQN